jgi:hypothetical protein
MTAAFFALSAAGPSLEAVILWRVLKHCAIRSYPYFSAYVLFDAASNLLLVATVVFWRHLFVPFYSAAELISVLTGFLIIWEVLRTVFPAGSTLHSLARNMLLGLSVLLIPSILAMGWRQANLIRFSYQYVPPVFIQYLTLLQAVLLSAVAALIAYYRVPLGRNIRGIVFGFGVYLSLCAMNFASLQIVHGFLPYWQVMSPALYIGLLAFWLWAFWEYSPSPARTVAHLNQTFAKGRWNQKWTEATSPIRRWPN